MIKLHPVLKTSSYLPHLLPRVSTRRTEGRAFSYQARLLWNQVHETDTVSTFKTRLKPFLTLFIYISSCWIFSASYRSYHRWSRQQMIRRYDMCSSNNV